MDEEIRIISEEEAKQLKRNPEDLELGRRIWELASQGKNKDQIAQRLKISSEMLDNALNAYRVRLGLSVDHYRMLDNERLDKIVATWMPAATEGPVRLLAFKKGEPIMIEDYDRAMKAAYLIIQAVTTRLRVIGATSALAAPGEAAGGLEGAKSYSERNIVIWLREVMPSIEKITREVEAEVVS